MVALLTSGRPAPSVGATSTTGSNWYWWRCWHCPPPPTGTVPLLAAVSLAFIFLVQLKVLYDNTQRTHRLNAYKAAAEELNERMHRLEKSGTRTDDYMRQVADYVRSLLKNINANSNSNHQNHRHHHRQKRQHNKNYDDERPPLHQGLL